MEGDLLLCCCYYYDYYYYYHYNYHCSRVLISIEEMQELIPVVGIGVQLSRKVLLLSLTLV